MKKQEYIGWGVFSLALVIAGLVVTYLNYSFLGLLFIAVGAASFWLVQRRAKKEGWFGKRKVKRY